MILVVLDNFLEILILILRNFTKLFVLRYLGICNVLITYNMAYIYPSHAYL